MLLQWEQLLYSAVYDPFVVKMVAEIYIVLVPNTSMLRNAAILFLAFLLCSAGSSVSRSDDLQFGRDVLPILSDRCFHCHGPDESHRQADLRLDIRDEAISKRNGSAAIVPNAPHASELVARITSTDPDTQMPPAKSHRKALSRREIEILKQWIDDGAKWGRHWSFEKPVRPALSDTSIHPIDALVRRRLELEGFVPSQRADDRTLARRLSFDLTGLPPTTDTSTSTDVGSHNDYEKLVERLLDSKHFGERMAMWWLDVARFSDTDGFQQDATRTNWPWRDWVIGAFNNNMPFDQFTIEQFAGDLLPEATAEQILATCFHRNHMTNGEGGRDPEESRIDYVIDRVNTTGTAWLGLTLGCCQCHSHKFDPISQQDYYSLFAFFNNIDEDGKAGNAAKPYFKYKSPFAERAVTEAKELVAVRKPVADAARRAAEHDFEVWLSQQTDKAQRGFQAWHPIMARELFAVEGTTLVQEPDGTIQASGLNPVQDDYRITAPIALDRLTGLRLEIYPHSTHSLGKLSRGKTGEFILTDVKLQVRRRGNSQVRDIDFASAIADAERTAKAREYGLIKDTLDDDPRNGWTTESHDPLAVHVAIFELAEPLSLAPDEEITFVMLHRSTDGDANIGRFRISATDQRGTALRSLDRMPLEKLAESILQHHNITASENRRENGSASLVVDEKLRGLLLDQFLTDHAAYQRAQSDLDLANKQLTEFKKGASEVSVMVLAERSTPLSTHVLERGVWDKKGAQVERAFPAAILDRNNDNKESSLSRLDLARWLTDPNNPLTARVVVNHLWQICFGNGLVRTPEDFGLQGELPSHPDVLDWLAVELVESGWNIKHLLRIIVTSETYRQSSHVSQKLLERDPDNRLLARGARYRLPSWMIRDAALRASGLMNSELGGPPVMPYQPSGVWAELTMGRFGYDTSQGPAQHRRTLYAFWRRSSAPTFLFDSAQRRTCEVRPLQTNTPLHALTLLNDQTILECSKALARRAVETRSKPEDRLELIFDAILNKKPSPAQQTVLLKEWNRADEYYRQSPAQAARLLDFGQPELNAAIRDSDRESIAAWMLIASLVFNLDEAITHE
ncbi:MAG: PSD1 and planctomycete cytochrome C domain-containing protein [Pirellula sp.]